MTRGTQARAARAAPGGAGRRTTPSPAAAERLAFAVGDYVAGGIVGAVTAAGVRALVDPGWDLALAMLAGMGVGMICHLAVGLLLSPAVGFFHVMVPASLIGMYGGMLFAMRDAMKVVTFGHAIVVGIAFGFVVTAVVQFYDLALARAAPDEVPVGGTTEE